MKWKEKVWLTHENFRDTQGWYLDNRRLDDKRRAGAQDSFCNSVYREQGFAAALHWDISIF